jgi:aspartyl-tRNA synthetase
MQRSHKCGELNTSHIGKTVTLQGWVAGRRDLGGLIFIDLRDRWGLVQIAFHPQTARDFKQAEELRKEYVVAVTGQVVAREERNINRDMTTGEIEINGDELEILNTAQMTPFYITDDVKVDENLRLKYRYLDLRRHAVQKNILLRSKVAKAFRDYLDGLEFVEVETPILTKSTPEGARDYLVPSRVHEGEFYALPQSPQLFKQLLMVSGLDRYYQLARCFRDEDLRADRQPEFTQVDIEASFLERDQFMTIMEGLTSRIIAEFWGLKLPQPFPRLQWREAMLKYGSDKPDLRFAMEITDVSDVVTGSQFKVFKDCLAAGGSVRGLKVSKHFSRKEVDELAVIPAQFGAKGLAWLASEEAEIRSPIAKFFTPQQLHQLQEAFGAQAGDTLLLVADANTYGVVLPALGALRVHLGRELSLYGPGDHAICWVIDFPLFERDEEAGRWVAAHHPFTAPAADDLAALATAPESVMAQAYDLVFNGTEIAGGSVRSHNTDIQLQVLKAIGFSEEEAKTRFGFLLEALSFGAPPHCGIAFGFDRLVAILAGEASIRSVIAFPKTNSAADLMTAAPSPVDSQQLAELHLKVTQ